MNHPLGSAELGDDAGRAHTYLDLALLADRHGRPREALPHALRTLQLYRTAGTPLEVAIALNAVGWYHAQLGDPGAEAVRAKLTAARPAGDGSLAGSATIIDATDQVPGLKPPGSARPQAPPAT